MTAIELSARTAAPVPANASIALAGRVLLAAIFILSGASKLADPAGTAGYIASAGLPFATLGAWGELWGALEPAERARVVALLVERVTWDGREQTYAVRWRIEGMAGGDGKEEA